MSELKWYWVYRPYLDTPERQKESAVQAGYTKVVFKSDADKVVALLTDKANYNEYAYKRKSEELADTCRFYEDELRHHKYKRCLATANYWVAVSYHCVDDKHRQRAERHHRKWLELAVKFKDKEAK